MPRWRSFAAFLAVLVVPLALVATALALIDANQVNLTAQAPSTAVEFAAPALEPYRAAENLTGPIPEVAAVEIVSLRVEEGVVTSLDASVAPTGNLQPLYSVNDVPVFSLMTDRPLWRDVAVGNVGADTQAVRSTIGETAAGALTCSELGRLHDRLRANAPAHPGRNCEALPLAQFVWFRGNSMAPLPDSTIEWAIQAGSPVPAAGTAVAAVTPAAVSTTFSTSIDFSGRQIDGILTQVGSAPIEVDAKGTGPTTVEAQLPTSWLRTPAAEGVDEVTIRISDRTTTRVAWVPDLLLAGGSDDACVRDADGRATAGRVIGADGAFVAFRPDSEEDWVEGARLVVTSAGGSLCP